MPRIWFSKINLTYKIKLNTQVILFGTSPLFPSLFTIYGNGRKTTFGITSVILQNLLGDDQ